MLYLLRGDFLNYLIGLCVDHLYYDPVDVLIQRYLETAVELGYDLFEVSKGFRNYSGRFLTDY